MTTQQIEERKAGLEKALVELTNRQKEINQALNDLQKASVQTQLQIAGQEAAIAECDFWLNQEG